MKRKLNVKKLILFFVLLFFVALLGIFGVFCYKLSPVSKKGEEVKYTVELGKSVYDVFADLEKEGFIKDAFALKVYSKIFGTEGIDAGEYTISKSYSAPKIYEILSTDNILGADEVTFVVLPGDTVMDVVETISSSSKVSIEDVKNVLTNIEYIKELINAYWFLDETILDDDIMYALEGYLYPDTYRVYKDAEVKDYVIKILENTKNKLDSVKNSIEKSNRSVHEILTMASLLQLEGKTSDDMKTIAGIFYNRLDYGMSLGSDAAAYYANGVKIGERDLYQYELDNCDNKYNTRCLSLVGLPVGPICSSGMDAIKASINPDMNEYLFFVTDKYGNLYPSKTQGEHDSIINRLINDGIWYEFE